MEEILLKRRIAFILGAGCSVAAGIPCFRGESGIFKGSLRQLFDSAYINWRSLDAIYKWAYECGKLFFDELKTKKPTFFHFWLKKLEERKKVSAIFSMNIDQLETSAGLKNCYFIHGRLGKLRCSICYRVRTISKKDLVSYQRKFRIFCKCRRSRRSKDKGHFLPDLFLYNDNRENPAANNALADSENMNIDCLIVVGTSLAPEVHGLHALLKILLAKGAPCYFVNREPPPARYRTKMVHLNMSSDEFAEALNLRPIKQETNDTNLHSIVATIKKLGFAKFSKDHIAKKHPHFRKCMDSILQHLLEKNIIVRLGPKHFKEARKHSQ